MGPDRERHLGLFEQRSREKSYLRVECSIPFGGQVGAFSRSPRPATPLSSCCFQVRSICPYRRTSSPSGFRQRLRAWRLFDERVASSQRICHGYRSPDHSGLPPIAHVVIPRGYHPVGRARASTGPARVALPSRGKGGRDRLT